MVVLTDINTLVSPCDCIQYCMTRTLKIAVLSQNLDAAFIQNCNSLMFLSQNTVYSHMKKPKYWCQLIRLRLKVLLVQSTRFLCLILNEPFIYPQSSWINFDLLRQTPVMFIYFSSPIQVLSGPFLWKRTKIATSGRPFRMRRHIESFWDMSKNWTEKQQNSI